MDPVPDVAAWYRTHGPMVLRRCRALLKDEELARDAMQEVFVQVVRRGQRLHDTAPSSLLYRMATNTCLNVLRTRRRHPEHPDDDLLLRLATFDDAEERTVARTLLDRLFAREQPSTAVMAVLHYVDGLTLEETAQEVGLSVSGVRKRLRTLRAHLDGLEDAA
ncbi:MAG: sigma-70 family RNA polymerase sigma factor [Alphaproteobacteria bacterium]|nr:sigma-70 family RNA polymerase sigma factor [Alphaproteobacteria bacterium]